MIWREIMMPSRKYLLPLAPARSYLLVEHCSSGSGLQMRASEYMLNGLLSTIRRHCLVALPPISYTKTDDRGYTFPSFILRLAVWRQNRIPWRLELASNSKPRALSIHLRGPRQQSCASTRSHARKRVQGRSYFINSMPASITERKH